jgi:hypothetical protein
MESQDPITDKCHSHTSVIAYACEVLADNASLELSKHTKSSGIPQKTQENTCCPEIFYEFC